MYTEPGRRLAVRRVAVMEEFLRAFYVEWDAQDFELADGPRQTSSLIETPLEASGKPQRPRPSDLRLYPSV